MRPIVLVAVALAVLPGSTAFAGHLSIGPTVGASLLQQGPDTSLSHGPLQDEVTVGRTALFGLVAGMSFHGQNAVSLEFVAGPYPNDAERYCIAEFWPTYRCDMQTMPVVSHAFLYEARYTRSFGHGTWRPYVGGGAGFKTYSYEQSLRDDARTTFLMDAGLGVEIGRNSLRLEIRPVYLAHHPPFQYEGAASAISPIELQVRASISVTAVR